MFSSRTLVKAPGRNFATLQQIQERIRAVTNIEKITKAMKMVSASKMKGDMNRLENGKDFAHQSVDMIFKCDTYMQRKSAPETTEPKELLVPISSDRGLCGAINSGVIREIKNYLEGKDESNAELFCIGDKGTSAAIRPFSSILVENVQNLNYPLNFAMSLAIGSRIIALSQDKDKVVIFYNEFISAIAFEIRRIELMSKKNFLESMKFQRLYEQKRPDASTANPALYELYIGSNLYHAQLQNAASEQSARMNAMENASSNAAELIEALQLEFNKARQAMITAELVEIISGASAV